MCVYFKVLIETGLWHWGHVVLVFSANLQGVIFYTFLDLLYGTASRSLMLILMIAAV